MCRPSRRKHYPYAKREEVVGTNLRWIGEKARQEPKLVFTSLYHHMTDVDNLRASYDALPSGRAAGADGVTKEEYGRRLEENLEDLSSRLKRMGYRPQPKLRKYIPKAGSEKGRPLGISCFEDKVVELAVKRVLEPIYEAVFEDSSHGYRPGRNPHTCLDELGRTIQQRRVNYIVEADISSFFDEVNHEWMEKFLRHRIGDPRVIRLIVRMLKGGVLEGGLERASEAGTPQGSILSPLLSNIYLHYVLDLWFKHEVRKRCRGEAYYYRFADDFLACFEHQDEATNFLQQLAERMERFGLKLSAEKTRCIEFGRWARGNAYKRGEKPKEFTFLGFAHFCGKTKKGRFKVKRRTNRKKLSQSLHKLADWARGIRNLLKKGEMLRQARARILGHLNYYAITDNSRQCYRYVRYATHLVFKWLNRKSQRRAYTWAGFLHAVARLSWPKPIIRKDLNPCRRAEAL
jgi:RNA-directed DNA polymerase